MLSVRFSLNCSVYAAGVDAEAKHRIPTPERMPVLIDGSITLRDLYAAAKRIDADAGQDPPHMTAVELIDVLYHYVHPAGYRGRGRPPPRPLHSG